MKGIEKTVRVLHIGPERKVADMLRYHGFEVDHVSSVDAAAGFCMYDAGSNVLYDVVVSAHDVEEEADGVRYLAHLAEAESTLINVVFVLHTRRRMHEVDPVMSDRIEYCYAAGKVPLTDFIESILPQAEVRIAS